ncbi:MAG TPA: hypothetical protein VJZ71_10345 [Phycisphaerae bacterium]|nr:hypothetical protein [Phycisphaerae bacterium]
MIKSFTIRVSGLLLLNIMFLSGGCSTTTVDTNLQSVTQVGKKPFSIGEDTIIWATADRICSAGGCTWRLNETAPSVDAPSFPEYQCVSEALTSRMSNALIELSSLNLKLSAEAKLEPSLVCSQLKGLGHRGVLLVTNVASYEAFTIGYSRGHLSIRIEAWDISSQKPTVSQEESARRTTPILWVMNYHDLNGRLNRAGREAMTSLLEHLIASLSHRLESGAVPCVTMNENNNQISKAISNERSILTGQTAPLAGDSGQSSMN